MMTNQEDILEVVPETDTELEAPSRTSSVSFVLIGAAVFPLTFVGGLLLGHSVLISLVAALVLASPLTIAILALMSVLGQD